MPLVTFAEWILNIYSITFSPNRKNVLPVVRHRYGLISEVLIDVSH